MIPTGNKAKLLSSVNHSTKTIHHHHHRQIKKKMSGKQKQKTRAFFGETYERKEVEA